MRLRSWTVGFEKVWKREYGLSLDLCGGKRQASAVHFSFDSADEVWACEALDEGYGLVQDRACDRFFLHSSDLFPSGHAFQVLDILLWRWRWFLWRNDLDDVFCSWRVFAHRLLPQQQWAI